MMDDRWPITGRKNVFLIDFGVFLVDFTHYLWFYVYRASDDTPGRAQKANFYEKFSFPSWEFFFRFFPVKNEKKTEKKPFFSGQ